MSFARAQDEVSRIIARIIWGRRDHAPATSDSSRPSQAYLEFRDFVRTHLAKAIGLIPHCDIGEAALESVGVVLGKERDSRLKNETNRKLLRKRPFLCGTQAEMAGATGKKPAGLVNRRMEPARAVCSRSLAHSEILRIVENVGTINAKNKYKSHVYELFGHYMHYVDELRRFESLLRGDYSKHVFGGKQFGPGDKGKRSDFGSSGRNN